jgi:hypothetical protein
MDMIHPKLLRLTLRQRNDLLLLPLSIEAAD